MHRFDRGAISNILEFFLFPGFEVDYSKVFELPEKQIQSEDRGRTDSSSLLTSSPVRNKLHEATVTNGNNQDCESHNNCGHDGHDHGHSHDHH